MKKREVVALLGAMTVMTAGSTLIGCGKAEDTVSANEVSVNEVSVNEDSVYEEDTETEDSVDIEASPVVEGGSLEEEPTPTEPITDNNNSITYQSDDETTTTPPSSTSDTTDIDYDSIDFCAILDKTETDPTSLTDAEVAYLKKIYTDLPKEPRKMSVSDWSAYWDKEFGATTSTPSTTTSDCTYQQDDPADCIEYKDGDVTPNGLKVTDGDCVDHSADCFYIVG